MSGAKLIVTFLFALSASTTATLYAQTRIGTYNGTFDPFHNGHLGTLLQSRHQLALDQVWVFPNYFRPGKENASPFESRWSALTDLQAEYPFIRVPRLEILIPLMKDQESPRENVRSWIAQHSVSDAHSYQIIGSDSFTRFLAAPGAMDAILLDDTRHLIVALRAGYDKDIQFSHPRVHIIDYEDSDTYSSTAFKSNPKGHEHWIPEPVLNSIKRFGLYGYSAQAEKCAVNVAGFAQ